MNTNEQIIANFLRPLGEGGAYTDEKLAALLAHAEDGKLAFWSCCCFAGVPTASHSLRGEARCYHADLKEHAKHPQWDLQLRAQMSNAFAFLGHSDEERRARLIPLIRSEMERRESSRAQVDELEFVTV